ncbi:hypothetical protein BaRGS_00022728 [Batillaria attramentaria]|uniref:Uncharacterized protein n=1 Tax=Batillaria attramentaria TaxID=370345 RepID=A0ABD0KG92_9CAEN
MPDTQHSARAARVLSDCDTELGQAKDDDTRVAETVSSDVNMEDVFAARREKKFEVPLDTHLNRERLLCDSDDIVMTFDLLAKEHYWFLKQKPWRLTKVRTRHDELHPQVGAG